MATISAQNDDDFLNLSKVTLDISLVIDRSGSMEGGRIEQVKKLRTQMIDQLSRRNDFSKIVCDDEAATIAANAAVAKQHERCSLSCN